MNYIILQKNIFMNLKEQKNGNDQLNSIRNEFNDRVNKKLFLGNSNRVYWTKSRDLEPSKKLPFIFLEDSNSRLHTDNILNCKCVMKREIFQQNMSKVQAYALSQILHLRLRQKVKPMIPTKEI